MQKYLSKILILTVMVAIFVVPVSLSVKINQKEKLIVNIETNKASASSLEEVFSSSEKTFKIENTNSNSTTFSGILEINDDSKCSGCRSNRSDTNNNSDLAIYRNIAGTAGVPQERIYFVIKNGENEIARKSWASLYKSFSTYNTQNPFSINTLQIAKLDASTHYTIHIRIDANIPWSGWDSNSIEFTTAPYNSNDPTDPNSVEINPESGGKPFGDPGFSLGCTSLTNISISGCIAQLTYIIWSVASLIFTASAYFLDFFIYYATNSSSYSNIFVEKAWSAMRDIANIFFIVALLYVAIKTVLSLNVTDNKKLIGSVIIIALVINFSLFTTKVVIDGSNILAKIFYNNIVSKDQKGNVSEAEAGGQKSISVGLVDKFDPQGLVTQENFNINPYTFIFMTLLLIIITLYASYIFFSIAVLFVARVVSLWISMIVSPIAFASFTVPFDIPGFGHKEWLDDLLKNAFLAPLFTFMLYIIIMFAGFLNDIIAYTDSPDLNTIGNMMQRVMSVTIPFIILAMLLAKSKTLVEKYSGEMGKAVMKGAQMIGGVALSAATGGAAMLGRTAIGGGGGYLANKAATWAEEKGLGRTATKLRDVSDFARKSSFDTRRVKIAGQSMASITGMKVGEGQKGGWNEMKKQQVEKRQKRAAELEKRGTSKEKKAVDTAEIDVKDRVLSTRVGQTIPIKLELENVDKEMDKVRKELSDAKLADDGSIAAKTEIARLKGELDAAKAKKDTIRADTTIINPDGSIGNASAIKDLETVRNKAKVNLDVASDKITTDYAKAISSNFSKNINSIFRLGAYSRAGADEAARKIRSGTKLDSGEKPH